ncbi:MAG: cytidine deaminase [Clostridiales bacterium]|nr:cytidine deaminase [Clostridiales bacterium]
MIDEKALIKAALLAREYAYAPYSGFSVGAALLSSDGRIFTGCNIESASYTPTTCAERTALVKAISEGVRHFSAIAVVGSKTGEPPSSFCSPCGVCRQFLYEFYSPGFMVYMAKSPDEFIMRPLDELLPLAFGPKSLLS